MVRLGQALITLLVQAVDTETSDCMASHSTLCVVLAVLPGPGIEFCGKPSQTSVGSVPSPLSPLSVHLRALAFLWVVSRCKKDCCIVSSLVSIEIMKLNTQVEWLVDHSLLLK